MRGNPRALAIQHPVNRSIPAYAGEPGVRGVSNWLTEVYPRVCGGTAVPSLAPQSYQGLSPRMRGNQHHQQLLGQLLGSIPAYAGEPAVIAFVSSTPAVYPRVCGGTVIWLVR